MEADCIWENMKMIREHEEMKESERTLSVIKFIILVEEARNSL